MDTLPANAQQFFHRQRQWRKTCESILFHCCEKPIPNRATVRAYKVLSLRELQILALVPRLTSLRRRDKECPKVAFPDLSNDNGWFQIQYSSEIKFYDCREFLRCEKHLAQFPASVQNAVTCFQMLRCCRWCPTLRPAYWFWIHFSKRQGWRCRRRSKQPRQPSAGRMVRLC